MSFELSVFCSVSVPFSFVLALISSALSLALSDSSLMIFDLRALTWL